MPRPVRSMLFVPADSEKKIAKSQSVGADAIILDLEDSVSPARKDTARAMAAEVLRDARGGGGAAVWVRINPFDSEHALADLAAVVRGGPAGIMLPKAAGPDDLVRLSHCLDVLELRDSLAPGSIRTLPVATETAGAALRLPLYAERAVPRLFGLTWGAEDLSADLGAAGNRGDDGRLALTYRTVRAMMLLAAKAAGVAAIDAIWPDFRDLEGLRADSLSSRREGFAGRMAIHPAQVEPINEAYSPSADEISHAEAVVAAFDAEPDAGVVALDGKMLDMPHLKQARHIIAMRDAFGPR